MFNYKIVDLPRIAIIGKEGLCTKEKNVVQDLWQQANSNFSDIHGGLFIKGERTCRKIIGKL